jgi:putative DNA primase/helicase
MPDDFSALFDAARAQLNPDAPSPADWPFQCLGHDRGRFYFYTKEGRQIIALRARELGNASELLALAPLRWLEGAFPGRESFNAKLAADQIMRACYAAGVFNPDALRGRGVWLDAGRRVMHLGDRLLVDGIETPLTAHRSAYIYEQARPINVSLGEPLTDAEGKRFLALCRAIAWQEPDRDGSLFAGWILSALIGGALAWRPHLWLLAEGGSGKTWIHDHIVSPALGDMALVLQGKTTEAGIRGELGTDARPVLFDEAETQSDADRARMQQVIDLARQASSEHGAPIVKGTKEGGSRRYMIRASFMFASINAGLTQAADESRFVTLSLTGGDPDQFQALKAAHAEAMVPNLCGRLLARGLAMAPTIRANADLLADAIARTGAGRRAGDLLGTLLACQMALITAEQIATPERAAEIVHGREWVRQAAAEAKVAPEWERALAHLMQAEGMRRTTNGMAERITVSELIASCLGRATDPSPRDADQALRRMGMRVMPHPDGDRLLIGNRSSSVADLFRATPWGAGWMATLARVTGAQRSIPARFTSAYQDKALSLPIAALLDVGENGG